MARRARTYVAGLSYHVVQRGNNRQPCFLAPPDRQLYLALWAERARWYGVAVHAWCLMTNHVHFLLTPSDAHGISHTLRDVHAGYAAAINRAHGRTGTLWEGRHRASLVDSERYALACHRYIELNPVRAGLVAEPADYPWSSFRSNALGAPGWLTPHPAYVALAADDDARRVRYRALFERASARVLDDDAARFRAATRRNWPVGDERFARALAERHGIALPGRRGRPPRRRDERTGTGKTGT